MNMVNNKINSTPFKNISLSIQKNDRMLYWEDLLGWMYWMKSGMKYFLTLINIQHMMQTCITSRYSNALKFPEIMAKILGKK